jgi:hypothetical protein
MNTIYNLVSIKTKTGHMSADIERWKHQMICIYQTFNILDDDFHEFLENLMDTPEDRKQFSEFMDYYDTTNECKRSDYDTYRFVPWTEVCPADENYKMCTAKSLSQCNLCKAWCCEKSDILCLNTKSSHLCSIKFLKTAIAYFSKSKKESVHL